MASAVEKAKPIFFEFKTDQTHGDEKIWFRFEREKDAETYKALIADTGRAFTAVNPLLNKTYTHIFLARGWDNSEVAKNVSPRQAMQKATMAAALLLSGKPDETKAVQ